MFSLGTEANLATTESGRQPSASYRSNLALKDWSSRVEVNHNMQGEVAILLERPLAPRNVPKITSCQFILHHLT